MFKIGKIEIEHFPILLAPMEDVTDPPFRKLCKKYGSDINYTEFISAAGLVRNAAKSTKKLDINDYERPVAIQIFGKDVNEMMRAAMLAEEAKPDIIDINFGCPVKSVTGNGAGSQLLANIPLMLEITTAVVKAVKISVTAKTRLGIDEKSKVIYDVAEKLQDCGIQALAIHGRTKTQMYKGEADWTLIGEVKNNPRMNIPIIGNGDVTSPEIALEKKNKYGVDAIMVGRAAIGNPYIFGEIHNYLKTGINDFKVSVAGRLDDCRQHLQDSMDWKGENRGILEMRKHYTHYFKGLPDFKKYRLRLVTTNSLSEICEIFEEVKNIYA